MQPVERHKRIIELFGIAAELAPEPRSQYLAENCEDESMRSEVEALCACDDRSSAWIDSPVLPDGELADFALDGSSLNPYQGFPTVSLTSDSPSLNSDSPVLPEMIDDFRIISLLGRGGMGTVFLAIQPKTEQRVALKIISDGLTSPRSRQRFDLETQILGHLRHPGIVGVHDAGTTMIGGVEHAYIAMEYIDGQPLTVHAKRHSMPLEKRLELMVKVCRAVQHAHNQGFIHRDVKPANILVGPDGQPKVLDFGIAKALDESQLQTNITNSGELLGTIPYMSPEQVRLDGVDVGTPTDIYALGITTYELITGRLPHDLQGKTALQAMRIVADTEPLPLRQAGKFSYDLELILKRALHSDPQRRYQSAAAFADDLVAYLEHRPVSIRSEQPLYTLSKRIMRHRRKLMSTAIVLLVPLVVVSITESRKNNYLADVIRETGNLEDLGHREKSDRLYDKALSHYPSNARLNVRKADNLLQLSKSKGDHTSVGRDLLNQALIPALKAVDCAPTDERYWNVLGVIQRRLGDYQSALNSFTNATGLKPTYSRALTNSAITHLFLGEPGLARDLLVNAVQEEEAIDSESKQDTVPFCGAFRELAAIQILMDEDAAAQNNVDTALACSDTREDEAFTLFLQAAISLRNRDFVTAYQRASEASLLFRYAEPRISRYCALASLRIGELENALSAAEQALRINDTPAFGHFIKSLAYANNNEFELARNSYQLAVDAWPAELQEPGDFKVTHQHAQLWFDMYDELEALRREAEELLDAANK